MTVDYLYRSLSPIRFYLISMCDLPFGYRYTIHDATSNLHNTVNSDFVLKTIARQRKRLVSEVCLSNLLSFTHSLT